MARILSCSNLVHPASKLVKCFFSAPSVHLMQATFNNRPFSCLLPASIYRQPASIMAPCLQEGSSVKQSPLIQSFSRCNGVTLRHKSPNSFVIRAVSTVEPPSGTASAQEQAEKRAAIQFEGVHHVGLLVKDLKRSLEFYQGILGLETNPERPSDKLPYGGVWFWVGTQMIHLMVLPNPDPLTGRPEHGGRDRHICVGIKDLEPLKAAFQEAGIDYTLSKSGRPAMFARDPDANAIEFTQV